jgi:glycosyltransferase involved in cell wall biosynthesis
MLDGPRRDPWAARHPPPAFEGPRWLFVSPELRRQVAAGGVDVDGCAVVPWGVDLDAFPLADERSWRGRLLCAGRLSALKGVDVAVAAAARLPDCTLEVAGAGPLEPELRAAAGANVRFLGPLPRPALARAYRRADVLLFGVRWQEPFGAVPLEAMASGTPVVATGTGGSSAFLRHEDTALLVPPGDPAAMAAAVRRLARDGALRARLRRAGRAEAQRYPAGRSHAAVIAALEEVAARRPAA